MGADDEPDVPNEPEFDSDYLYTQVVHGVDLTGQTDPDALKLSGFKGDLYLNLFQTTSVQSGELVWRLLVSDMTGVALTKLEDETDPQALITQLFKRFGIDVRKATWRSREKQK